MNEIKTAETPLVEVRNVTKRYGRTVALNDVGIKITAGRTHALVGRNGAGKSTLVSIMTGLQPPDSGEVFFNGQPAPAPGDLAAWRQHVACVYQYSTIMRNMSVAENLLMNRQDLGKKFIDWGALHRKAQDILDEWNIPVDVRMEAGLLDVENRQLVEIARSLSFGARFIILDEPTAMLDGKAILRLFDRMQALQKQGVTFMFISHHLSEVYDVCQDVTVYRDAKHILTAPVEELDQRAMIEAMTGERYVDKQYETRQLSDETTLDIRNLSHQYRFKDISLRIRKGEMVGLAGSGGCGKVGLAETIVGLQPSTGGEIRLNGETYAGHNVRAALDAGIGFVPQDRHHEGFVPDMSIAENASMAMWPKLGKGGLLNRSRISGLAKDWIAKLDVKTYGPDQPVIGLSGGNQQKVVQARAMANHPDLLVMISPTAGVDIKSKETLLDCVQQTSETEQTSVLIVSDELDDLRGCDRVLVMYHGAITHEFPLGWQDEDLIAAMEGLYEGDGYRYQYQVKQEASI
ncbi:sugar ABC transporter ATP-binding protein [Cardiobacteriaceae bacterium TAE3-ERU3]|nr:sugar ABC transporter ATP-binding protein [Cardiobacteriaceae bacterium TAE3-ERU3]